MSICPICNKRVKRKNRTKKKGVWIHKRCPVPDHPGYEGRILPVIDLIESAIIEKEDTKCQERKS